MLTPLWILYWCVCAACFRVSIVGVPLQCPAVEFTTANSYSYAIKQLLYMPIRSWSSSISSSFFVRCYCLLYRICFCFSILHSGTLDWFTRKTSSMGYPVVYFFAQHTVDCPRLSVCQGLTSSMLHLSTDIFASFESLRETFWGLVVCRICFWRHREDNIQL